VTERTENPERSANGPSATPLPDMGIDAPDSMSAKEIAAHERWLQENRPPHHG
jgi:hypothetical protein